MSIVYFKSEKELISFCEVLFDNQKVIDIKWIKHKHFGNELRLSESILKPELMLGLAAIFTGYRMKQLVKEVIEKVYLYSNDVEIEEIYKHTLDIVELEMFSDSLFGVGITLNEYIINLFDKQVQVDCKIYFDSLVTFCTTPLKNCLVDAVALGIDEFKREEEYQDFLESVRVFIERRGVRTAELHILQADQFAFFKASGKEYSRLELRNLMYDAALYIVGLDENETNLSPVIALSPKKIYIYGNDPTEPKTLSLISLFQEKVEFISKEYFPFRKSITKS